MKNIFLVLVLISSISLHAQKRANKFYSQKDSVTYSKYQAMMNRGIHVEKEGKSYVFDSDSTKYLYKDIREKMQEIETYYYLSYEPNPQYTDIEIVKTSQRKDTIEFISISGTGYHAIPLFILKCKNLKAIELINTKIDKIPWLLNWSIFKLDSLQTIKVYNHLSNNPLKFKKNTNLEKLIYRESPYAAAPKKLHRLKNLKDLDLVRNDLRSLDLNLSKMKKLHELNLSHNRLAIADLARDTVQNLSNLILRHNKLTSVTAEIGYFKSLRELQLAENNISSNALDPAIGSLKNLELISFYKNALDSLPNFLFHLKNLKEFDINYNNVQRIPSEIEELNDLEKLFISYNRIFELPESIGKLSKLQEIYLHHNRISYLPNSFCNLKEITDFHINNNYFNDFPTCILKYKKLEDLDISFNNITKIATELRQLSALKLLWMRGIVFEANNKKEAEEIKETIEALMQSGVKVSMEFDQTEI